jgi:hypothetical protein
MKTTLDKDQLDYLIGETMTYRGRLQNANRDAKKIMNETHGDIQLRYRWIWAKGEVFKTDKELMFINDLLTDLQDMKAGE